MIKKSLQIRDNFEQYTQLLEKRKYIDDINIDLAESSSNWRQQSSVVRHDSEEEIIFNAAKQKIGQKYGLRIFIKSLSEEPVYYFDSDGPAHFNSNGSTSLATTKISTPHINYYDSDGIKCARRSEFIEKNVDQLQNDINFGMEYFCVEASLNNDSHIPKIREMAQLEMFEDDKADIHTGIDFLDEI